MSYSKKGGNLLRERVEIKYKFILENAQTFSVALLCNTLNVSRSGYYAWQKREIKSKNTEFESKIIDIFTKSRELYGWRRIKGEFKNSGQIVNHKKIQRHMKKLNLQVRTRKKFKATTNSKHCLPTHSNLLKRHFYAYKPNERWVGDISYIKTAEGWLYLAVVIDLFSRKIKGWHLSQKIDTELVITALSMAKMQAVTTNKIIFHSDRGVQYAATNFQKFLLQNNIIHSMSGKGSCYDNAVAESFFSSIKKELIYLENFSTVSDAKNKIFEYIEVFYNRVRLHSSNNYLSPNAVELKYAG